MIHFHDLLPRGFVMITGPAAYPVGDLRRYEARVAGIEAATNCLGGRLGPYVNLPRPR
jgi:hypothetical protein